MRRRRRSTRRRSTPRSPPSTRRSPLEARLIAAVDILRRRFADILQLRTAVGMMQVSSASDQSERHRAPTCARSPRCSKPDRDQIRRDPLEAAHLLRGLTIAGTHPALILDEPLSSAEIVSLFLDGVRRATPTRPTRSDRRC